MAALSLLAWFLGLIPRKIQWGMGQVIAFLWWDVFRLRRFTLYRNISIVFPDAGKEEKLKIIRGSLANMGYNFLEILQIPRYRAEDVDRDFVFEGVANYEAARAKNKGLLFLSLHLGNGDLGVTAMSLKGIHVHLISKKFRNPTANRIWFGLRETKGTRFIDPHGRETPFQILKALKNKEAVTFVLDQFMGKPYGIPTRFFGRKTGTAYGLALFATKTRAPVVPVYSYRDADLRIHVVFEPEVPLVENEDKDLQMSEMTQRYNGVLEKLILRHPEQWMWVHRRWKKWE